MTPAPATPVVHVDKSHAAKDAPYALSLARSPVPRFVAFDARFIRDIIGPETDSPQLTLIEKRSYQFAHEAGVYIKPTNSVYFTANFQTCDPIELYAINCDTHEISKLDYPDVVQANGACNFDDKVLYCAQGDLSRPSGLVLVDPVTGRAEMLINNFQGRHFNSVNDVVVHHGTGDIWFTDPTYGYAQAFRPSPELPAQVYRFRPSTGECVVVADGFEMCNGLCFSPDYSRMYITDTGAIQAHNGPGDGHQLFADPRKPASIYVYDVVDDGTRLGHRRTFAYCDTGVPDGIKCDENGYVYSGCGDGVHVWDSQGILLGKIIVGGITANFNFVRGGIWMFAEEELWFCKLKAKGALVDIEC
ncbi:gluconolactonase [Coccidioides immitis RS]|uniref:Gluconolactonase n=3 Tax=Coccidioides immitis TaxID=5501 RepID=J3K7Q5_COCIM|nr:gluconolactonase [Coccidioides immitis RS]EAS30752.3 gluconolactonase [Coccidioides immitis RS]KMP03330.1 AkeP [Coccidioides immitis RMSCC 2394]KMU73872.1 AkeP [Coccidioides immitis RMSCC 3703]